MSSKNGSLVVVGTGIQAPRHTSIRAESEIRHAGLVYYLADSLASKWIADLRPDAITLQTYYGEDKDRRQTYREMTDVIVTAARAGNRVCLVLYGHPGVFAQVSHAAMATLEVEGFDTRMEPGISAEACLYADLGLDPGDCGVQSFEATRFLAWRHALDPATLVVLWQVALTGNLDCIGFEPDPAKLQVLVDKLSGWYRLDTPVILYEAAQLPIEDFRARHMALADLPTARYKEYTTLVIPPARQAGQDARWIKALAALD